ncbi:MAG TPA: helix-turn-helix domain-containing protein [Limosilactobacillus oris]|uniref:helix-turn-helix domain-containing protein n=1 Tax=Limosilactobacillus oris TaxID=1632 RepID=UPI001D7EEBEA|nr:helix-turn-helix domain-containing protein [Limosilactobacillus oris]HJF47965.1 helix-turn-helix domain-containing protein [Limosilactobacillus oris]
MDINLRLPPDLETAINQTIEEAVKSAVDETRRANNYPPYLNRGEAAAYCGVSRGVFNAWANKYGIPVVQIDGVNRFNRERLDEFMEQHTK